MVFESETSVDHLATAAFIQALAERDFAAMKQPRPGGRFPGAPARRSRRGRFERRGSRRAEPLFGVYDRYRIVGFETGYLGDMIRIGYRVGGHTDDEWRKSRAEAYCEAVDDRCVRVNLVCSGVYDRDPPSWA